MASSTYKTFLMYENAGTMEILVPITDFPDLGGAPESLDTTTLSDGVKTSIPGIQDLDSLEFTANYTDADYDKVNALVGKDTHFDVWMGGTTTGGVLKPDGSIGKWEWDGQPSVYVNGAGVNEVVQMTITISASTEIKKI